MVGFRRPRCTIHKKKKNKPSFLKKIFLLSLYFSSLWPPFLLSIQTFLKRANSFWKKPQSFFFLPIPLSLLLLSIIILLHTRNQNTDLPTLLIYILLILLFLLHHNIDAFKRNDYYFAKTNKYQIFEQKQNPICKNFVHVKRANK